MRLAVRSLLKAPGFSAAVVLVLAIGLGANAALFAVVNRLVARNVDVLVLAIRDSLRWAAAGLAGGGVLAFFAARALAARGESPASHRGRRGARLARRDDREYREYLREDQRSQAGCGAGRMQPDFHHGLLAGALYEVPPTDLVTFAGAGAAATMVVLFGSTLAARTAMNVDPLVAIRDQ
jgi:hypothetical protein